MEVRIMSIENNSALSNIESVEIERISDRTGAEFIPDNYTHLSVQQFREDATSGKMSRLARVAHEKGHSTSVLQAGDQLTTDEVVGKVWTIIAVSYAHVPDENDPSGMSKKMYPCCVFMEAPDRWYNLGQIAGEMVADWALEMEEDPEESPNLPNVNNELALCGGVRVYMQWKEGKNRKYVRVTVA